VDHHHVHPDELEEHHVAREALFEVLVGHGIAAILDDDGLAVKSFDVRECLGENGGFVGGGDRTISSWRQS
jgi:hypothetical protein